MTLDHDPMNRPQLLEGLSGTPLHRHLASMVSIIWRCSYLAAQHERLCGRQKVCPQMNNERESANIPDAP